MLLNLRVLSFFFARVAHAIPPHLLLTLTGILKLVHVPVGNEQKSENPDQHDDREDYSSYARVTVKKEIKGAPDEDGSETRRYQRAEHHGNEAQQSSSPQRLNRIETPTGFGRSAVAALPQAFYPKIMGERIQENVAVA